MKRCPEAYRLMMVWYSCNGHGWAEAKRVYETHLRTCARCRAAIDSVPSEGEGGRASGVGKRGVMTKLQSYTDDELRAELERRARRPPAATPLTEVDWDKVYGLCTGYISDLATQGWVDDDLEHYIFEAAITAIYGDEIWNYIRQVMK